MSEKLLRVATTSKSSWKTDREHSGSVVECLTRDREAAGSSLTGVTALWSLSKTHLSELSTGSTRKTRPCLTEILLMGHKESNQTSKQTKMVDLSSLVDKLPFSRGDNQRRET